MSSMKPEFEPKNISQDVKSDGDSAHEVILLDNEPNQTSENKYFLPSNTTSSSPGILQKLRIGVSSKFTINLTANTKDTCKNILIVLQILLCLLLFIKLTYGKLNISDKPQTDYLEPRLSTMVPAEVDFNKTTTQEHENKNNVKNIPTQCAQIEVSSEEEYQEKTKNMSEQTNICLTVHFKHNTPWSFLNTSIQFNMVKEIIFVGCVEMLHLSVVLNKFNYAYKLTFGQTNEQFCDVSRKHSLHSDSQWSSRTKIYLLNLTEIAIENIDCPGVFEFLSKTFYMNAVKSLKIKNIDIDYGNVMGIRLLLKQFKYSLEILHFTDVMWKVDLFESFSYAVPNLRELEIDFLSPLDTIIDFLGGFKAAEHLIKIVSTQGYLPYSQYMSVFDFKMIQNITLGVEISGNVTSLDNLFPINVLPKLDYVELFLNFSNTSKCHLLIDYDFRRSYDTKLHSNCDDDF